MPALGPWRHAGIALGLLTLLAAGLVWPALTGRHRFGEGLAALERPLMELDALVARRHLLDQEIRTLRSELRARGGFLTERSPALAAAALQKHLRDLIAANGGDLVSTQTVDAGEEQRVTVAVQMRGDTRALQGVLYAIGAGRLLVTIDSLSIRQRTVRTPQGRGPDSLDVRFEADGYVAGEESP